MGERDIYISPGDELSEALFKRSGLSIEERLDDIMIRINIIAEYATEKIPQLASEKIHYIQSQVDSIRQRIEQLEQPKYSTAPLKGAPLPPGVQRR